MYNRKLVCVTNELRSRSALEEDRGLLVRSGRHLVMATLQDTNTHTRKLIKCMQWGQGGVWEEEDGVRTQGSEGGGGGR